VALEGVSKKKISFARIELANKNVAKIRLEGVAEVFEIVAID
jgi:hypothetical protein